jgi:hypothetical protein
MVWQRLWLPHKHASGPNAARIQRLNSSNVLVPADVAVQTKYKVSNTCVRAANTGSVLSCASYLNVKEHATCAHLAKSTCWVPVMHSTKVPFLNLCAKMRRMLPPSNEPNSDTGFCCLVYGSLAAPQAPS